MYSVNNVYIIKLIQLTQIDAINLVQQIIIWFIILYTLHTNTNNPTHSTMIILQFLKYSPHKINVGFTGKSVINNKFPKGFKMVLSHYLLFITHTHEIINFEDF